MAVWMQPVKLPYSKGFHEPHGVEQTERTRCHMCDYLSCIPQRGRREPWRFYCERLRKRVEPRKIAKRDCPIGREAPRGRPPNAPAAGRDGG